MNPAAIEKCNVSLAVSVFHESTINALDQYSNQFPEFGTTASFLRIILSWWNRVNVKSRYIGERKRDRSKYPVSFENLDVCEYLSQSCDWLTNWQTNIATKNAFSKETFEAARQTCGALPHLVNYLLEEKYFDYVLLGFIQSDCIERRFGCYRQLNGANYYASVRQFIEAEKSIRLKSLIKYSNLDLQDLKGIFKDINTAETAAIDSEANLLLDKICTDLNANSVTEDDEAILFYISGYISRSLTKQVKCASCYKLLVKYNATPSLTLASDCPHDENEVTAKENFLNTINRRGLSSMPRNYLI